MNLSLSPEQFRNELLYAYAYGALSMAGLFVVLRALAAVVIDTRRAVREGAPLVGEEFERNRKRETP